MLKLITAPSEIITLADAAEFMRAEFSTSEENLINTLITAARQMCEDYLFRRIGVQTVELREKGFPANNAPIILPAPLISVESIKYLDGNNAEQTLDASSYVVSTADPGMIIPVNSWPSTSQSGDSLRVTFIAGYSAPGSPQESELLPSTIKTAMLMQIADMYENREAQVERPLTANPTVQNLIGQYRLEWGI